MQNSPQKFKFITCYRLTLLVKLEILISLFVTRLSWAAKIHSISSSKYSVFWCRQKSFVIPCREKHKMTFCLIYGCNNVLSHPPEALFFSTLWTNIEFQTINMILLVRFHKCIDIFPKRFTSWALMILRSHCLRVSLFLKRTSMLDIVHQYILF